MGRSVFTEATYGAWGLWHLFFSLVPGADIFCHAKYNKKLENHRIIGVLHEIHEDSSRRKNSMFDSSDGAARL